MTTLNLDIPENMERAITSGLIWQTTPEMMAKAAVYMVEHPELPLDKVPDETAMWIEEKRGQAR